ncbi:MAG: tRNA 2-thiouridine(34) synthase MnmA [Eubacterium sp.]
MKKALIAMSGGVDSSVAAIFMKEQGYSPIGVTMKLYDNEDINISKEKTCCSLSDIEDARSVAYKLGFPYYVFNFKSEFKEKVIDKFVNCYKCGMTPNPCIECNRHLKFRELYRRAQEQECDVIVTGHYARIRYDEETKKYQLLKGVDETKDQSYVLYHMTQEQLAHTVFPLGDYTKEEIRKKAAESGLVNAGKHDSQDICFIPDGNHKKFIEKYTGQKIGPGNFLDLNGNVIGKHFGYYRYTIGQRKGVVVSEPGKHYVCEIRPETNEVVVGRNKDLFKSELIANDFNWISGEAPEEPIEVSGRTRYHQELAKAVATVLEDGSVKVVFEQPQRAITKGQSVVLYDGDVVLGGGTISEVNETEK